ncbi:hypothetical protein [Mycolicibacterium palauense]|uniref:hypothetical protein n=1 Tax=Mycolicibacterium palauense TaxID=2034511 RepID=UPI000BFED020|nr:hypothetical protein [Mycolicibacterium palauense]
MEFLEALAAQQPTTGTVVQLADGRFLSLDSDAGESYVIGQDGAGVLTVTIVVKDRLGERQQVWRYSPAAWIGVVETSDPAPPGTALKFT